MQVKASPAFSHMHVGLWIRWVGVMNMQRCYYSLCGRGLGAGIWWKGWWDCGDGGSLRDSVVSPLFLLGLFLFVKNSNAL